MEKKDVNVLNESPVVYETSFGHAELELLRDGLNRSYKERFEFATRLYKIQMTMNKANVTHKPSIKK